MHDMYSVHRFTFSPVSADNSFNHLICLQRCLDLSGFYSKIHNSFHTPITHNSGFESVICWSPQAAEGKEKWAGCPNCVFVVLCLTVYYIVCVLCYMGLSACDKSLNDTHRQPFKLSRATHTYATHMHEFMVWLSTWF